MDRLTAAKVFVDVAYSGSFTATADRLEMSRPMVTRYIETMEDWLQTRLLHRTTRKISLTTAGERCLAEVEQWLQAAESLTFVSRDAGALSGKIRLAASMSFSHSQLIPAITGFMAEHPKVEIDIDLQDTTSDLIAERIDLAIRIAANPDPSLIGKPIGRCASVLVASPAYLAASPVVVNPEDLAQQRCLGYKNFEQHVWHLKRGDEHTSVNVQCQLTANEATTLLEAARHGAGIAMQPTYLANSLIQQGHLTAVLPEWQPNDMAIYALYPSRKHLSPTVRALIDYLDAYFQVTRW